MVYRLSLCLLLSFVFSNIYAQNYSLEGRVIDNETKNGLAFVNIGISGESNGCITDIDGKFKITVSHPILELKLSYVGYEQVSYPIKNPSNFLTIKMQRKSFLLKEIEILPGENPADRIIKKVVENRIKNNPEKIRSFSYTSYNKLYTTVDMNQQDSINSLDSSNLKFNSFLKRQHLFLMESVSKRKFLHPDRNNEKVIASRVSGLQNPSFTILATQIQSFTFYNDFITVMEKDYLNPISKGSTNKYLFIIEDTIYSGKDSIYVISFRPKKDKNFEGMKGILSINTNGYAVQNVIASPFENRSAFSLKIQQRYELIDGKQWFPVQLNTDWFYKNISFNDSITSFSSNTDNEQEQENDWGKLKIVCRSYLKDIVLLPAFKKREFNRTEIEFKDDAFNKAEDFWNNYRIDSLTAKDKKTYKVIDSIGNARKFDLKLKLIETLSTGRLPYKKINFDLDRVLNYNRYEGLRFEIGLHTNQKLSRFFSVGGYVAYGLHDKAIKYGSDVTFNIYPKSDFQLKLSYLQDVIESGNVSFFDDKKLTAISANTEVYRKYFVSVMDSIQKKEASISFRALQYFKFNLSLNQQARITTNNYQYRITENGQTKIVDAYNFTEAGIGVRFAFKEKFLKTLSNNISLGTNYPIIYGQLTKGINNFLEGNYDYTRCDLKIEKTFKTKIGKPGFQLLGGYVAGNVPYTLLYNGKAGFYSSPSQYPIRLSISNSFETMRYNEFLSNRYAALFLSHNFGSLLYKTKKFQPEIIMVNNIGIGSLRHKQNHLNIPIKTMEKGYFESGILINNIIKTKFSGLGIGLFYRYGPYALSKTSENIAVKLSLGIAF